MNGELPCRPHRRPASPAPGLAVGLILVLTGAGGGILAVPMPMPMSGTMPAMGWRSARAVRTRVQ